MQIHPAHLSPHGPIFKRGVHSHPAPCPWMGNHLLWWGGGSQDPLLWIFQNVNFLFFLAGEPPIMMGEYIGKPASFPSKLPAYFAEDHSYSIPCSVQTKHANFNTWKEHLSLFPRCRYFEGCLFQFGPTGTVTLLTFRCYKQYSTHYDQSNREILSVL